MQQYSNRDISLEESNEERLVLSNRRLELPFSFDNRLNIVVKWVGIVYFFVLFLIVGSNFDLTEDENITNLYVYTSNGYSYQQNNYILIKAVNTDGSKNFKGFKLGIWLDSGHDYDGIDDFGQLRKQYDKDVYYDKFFISENLNENGENSVYLPAGEKYSGFYNIVLAKTTGEIVQRLKVYPLLFDSGSREKNDIQDPESVPVSENWIKAEAPASFIPGQINELRILAYQKNEPYSGPITIEQIYGEKAWFNPWMMADISGITSTSMVINGVSDFKITAGDMVTYVTLTPNDKTLHAKPVFPIIQTGYQYISLEIGPRSLLPDQLYFDFFDGNAWLDHYVIATDDLLPGINSEKYDDYLYVDVSMPSGYNFGDSRETSHLFVMRVSTSGFATPENSQTIAFMTFNSTDSSNYYGDDYVRGDTVLSEFAYHSKYYTNEYRAFREMLNNAICVEKTKYPTVERCKKQAKSYIEMTDCDKFKKVDVQAININCHQLARMSIDAANLIARQSNPVIALHTSTENPEQARMTSEEDKKSMCRKLGVWQGLGTLLLVLAVISEIRKKKPYWIRYTENPSLAKFKGVAGATLFVLIWCVFCILVYKFAEIL